MNNNKFFVLSHRKEISLSGKSSILKENEIGDLITSIELIEEAKKESEKIINETNFECEHLRQKAKEEGFNEGLNQWANILKSLENEADNIREQMESIIIKIAIKAAQMVVGQLLEENPKNISQIIAQSLKSVSEHKSVTIYCSPSDYENINNSRQVLKDIIANANTFAINTKQDLPPMGYIIQTDRGVINSSDPNKIWDKIEKVFSEQIENTEKAK